MYKKGAAFLDFLKKPVSHNEMQPTFFVPVKEKDC